MAKAGFKVFDSDMHVMEPADLWQRYLAWKGIGQHGEPIYAQDYYPGKPARYYQMNAVNRAIEAVTKTAERAERRS